MTFVTNLQTDDETIERPRWENVEDAIRRLDATSLSEVMLAPSPPLGPPEGDHHMAVGGGKDGLYIVYMTEDNLQFWNLADPSTDDDKMTVVMTIGGQESDYRRAQLVALTDALVAARWYFEHGRRADGLLWSQA